MSRQLLDAYRFAQAQGPDAERRWLKSCTPYQRGVLERALTNEAEDLAHPLPGDTAPQPLRVVGEPGAWFTTVIAAAQAVLADIQRSCAVYSHTHASQTLLNDQLLLAGRALSRHQETDLRLLALAATTGTPIDDLRRRFRDYVAQRPWSAAQAIDEFCYEVRQETGAATFTYFDDVTVQEAQSRPRRSFKDGLRRRWWDR